MENKSLGVANSGFNDGGEVDKSSPAKPEESFEMSAQPSNDISVSVESSKSHEKPAKDDLQPNIIVRWNLKARSYLQRRLFGESQGSRIFWLVIVNGAATGFLIASIIRYEKNESSDIDWCDGVGFMWVLYCFVYVHFLYWLGKRFFEECISGCLSRFAGWFKSLGANKYFSRVCYSLPILALTLYVALYPGKSGRRIFSYLGIITFIILGYLFSRYPAHIKWRPVISGLVLQFAFGLLTIQFETGKNVLDCLGRKVTRFLQFTEEGTSFVYGYLGKPENDASPIFAFSVLPVVYFLSFFINLLSYYGALQWFIMRISFVVQIFMGTTVCESVNAAGSIFLGMTEAPLLIQSYLKDLTKSEICAILCAGWSTVAGVVMAAYIQFGVKASHLIAASVMSAPASLSYSKLLYPETEQSKTTFYNIVLHKEEASNFLDAASKGALCGIKVVGSIMANIIAFLAFIAFLDSTMTWVGGVIGFEELSFQFVMSKIFYPVSFLMGVDEGSLEDVAYLVGIKTVANEFQAYQKLGELIKENKLSERSEIIATYALCGFSNFGSIGITVGTLAAMEPRQTSAVTEVALPAFIAANIVCFLTACVAGCLID